MVTITDPKTPTRAQLAKICRDDQDAIRLLERLFQVGGTITPTDLTAIEATLVILQNEIDAITPLPLSDLAQSGAAVGDVPQWSGTVWAPAAVSGGSGSGTLTWMGL